MVAVALAAAVLTRLTFLRCRHAVWLRPRLPACHSNGSAAYLSPAAGVCSLLPSGDTVATLFVPTGSGPCCCAAWGRGCHVLALQHCSRPSPAYVCHFFLQTKPGPTWHSHSATSPRSSCCRMPRPCRRRSRCAGRRAGGWGGRWAGGRAPPQVLLEAFPVHGCGAAPGGQTRSCAADVHAKCRV